MVLIFDDNQYRRRAHKRAFRDTELPCKIDSYEHCEYLTKPLVTVLVMPKLSEVDYLIRNMQGQGTVFVIVLKREAPQLKHLKNVVIDPDASVCPEIIKKIIMKEYGYNLYQDFTNRALIDKEDEDIYYGGRRLRLTKTEYKIARFLCYNQGKTFMDEEILEYLNLRITTSSVSKYVSYINHKCVENYRKKLILRSSFGFKMNPIKTIVTNALD